MKALFSSFNKEISIEINYLSQYGEEIYKSDSLLSILKSMVFATHNKQLNFIKSHTNNYVIFWYFINFVVSNLGVCRSNDVNDYQFLLNYLNKYFPNKFKKSIEAKIFKGDLKLKIRSLIESKKYVIQR